MIKCSKCGKRFEGDACPDCGQSAAVSLIQQKRKPRVFRTIWKVITTLITIAVIVVIALIVLDLTAAAHDPANSFLYNTMQAIRDLFPAKTVASYEALRDEAVYMWQNLWTIIRNGNNAAG